MSIVRLTVSPFNTHIRIFSVDSRRAHRDLHSFPTRRSSDLPGSVTSHAPTGPTRHRPRQPRPAPCRDGARPGPVGRSEEHTSELQSQSNLVCRLLLEKKKNKEHSKTRSGISPPNGERTQRLT